MVFEVIFGCIFSGVKTERFAENPYGIVVSFGTVKPLVHGDKVVWSINKFPDFLNFFLVGHA